jgi:hypothetical protein
MKPLLEARAVRQRGGIAVICAFDGREALYDAIVAELTSASAAEAPR